MELRSLGRSGLLVSRLALGTMTWGSDTGPDDAAAQLKAFTDAGGTLVDTADVYGGGEAERLLGTLVAESYDRTEVIIASKAVARPDHQRRFDASRGHLLSALDATLRRLRTDYLDLWQLHAWDDRTPLDETLAAVDTAVSSGRVRYAGISNYTGWQAAKAAAWQAAWPGRTPVASAQVEYSLLARGAEVELLPACRDAGIGVLPWSPLGRGVLTGKYRNGVPADSRAASSRFDRFVGRFLDDRSAGIVQAVATASDGLGVSPLAVSLAWVRDQPGVVAPVVGARTAEQLVVSLDTEGLSLPPEIISALDDVSAPGQTGS